MVHVHIIIYKSLLFKKKKSINCFMYVAFYLNLKQGIVNKN